MKVQLTTKFIDAAKARKGVRAEYWDRKVRRLGLRVSPTGHKSWVLMYRRQADGAKRRMLLGSYPVVSLVDARTKALEALTAVERGGDPAGDRQDAKHDVTFRDLANAYLARYAKAHRKSWSEDDRRLRLNILPAIGNHTAALVTASDLINLHDSLTERGAPIEANRNIQLVRRVYSWAIGKQKVQRNPAEKLQLNPERSRDRVLTIDEIRCFWRRLEGLDISPGIRNALRIALITGQRIGEVIATPKVELDMRRAQWTIAGNRTKNGLSHTVPLSPSALSLFRDAMNEAKGDFVFPGEPGEATEANQKAGRPLERRSVSRALARNLDKLKLEKFTPHDLRRTAASQMAALGIDRVVTGKVLNHASVDRDTITGSVYDRHGYDAEKRRALDRWADRLAEIVGAGAKAQKVVRLR